MGEETEKRTDENRRRKTDSEAVVGEELELENCFRQTACVFVCACFLSLTSY